MLGIVLPDADHVAAAVLVWQIPAPPVMFGGMLHFGLGPATYVMRSAIAGLSALLLPVATPPSMSMRTAAVIVPPQPVQL